MYCAGQLWLSSHTDALIEEVPRRGSSFGRKAGFVSTLWPSVPTSVAKSESADRVPSKIRGSWYNFHCFGGHVSSLCRFVISYYSGIAKTSLSNGCSQCPYRSYKGGMPAAGMNIIIFIKQSNAVRTVTGRSHCFGIPRYGRPRFQLQAGRLIMFDHKRMSVRDHGCWLPSFSTCRWAGSCLE